MAILDLLRQNLNVEEYSNNIGRTYQALVIMSFRMDAAIMALHVGISALDKEMKDIFPFVGSPSQEPSCRCCFLLLLLSSSI